jgi:C4-dicarboxylate-specific signal transduction histidine kinase
MRARVRHAYRLASLGRLTRGVADDFARVIAAIRNQLDHLQSDAAPFGVRVIRRATETGAALARQLRAFADAPPVCRRAVDAHALLQQLRSDINPKVCLDIQLDAVTTTVRVDPDGLRQGLADLIAGFAIAMPDGSIVHIATRNLLLSDESADSETSSAVCLAIEVSNTAQAASITPHTVFGAGEELPVSTGIMLALVVLDDVSFNAGGFVEVSANASGATVVTIHLNAA